MRIFNTYELAKKHKPYCIALGSFDGVHIGHQKLVEILKYNASLFDCASMIYTFGVHPRKILKPDKSLYMITNSSQRSDLMAEMGVDILFLENFEKIMNLSAEQFFHDIIIEKFNAKCLIIGYNFKFGKNNEGDATILTGLGAKYGIMIDVVAPVVVNDEVVSSTLIRHMIHDGLVDDVYKYLGRTYSIQGKVIHGKKNGKAMGIRTANIEAGIEAIIPLKGVYITDTKIGKDIYKSITNIGVNPTFKGSKISIETHILGFEGDLYDKDIEVYFIKRLRDEVLFENIENLKKQINSDIETRLRYRSML
ncbi:MAG: bifunctional riboflavin kinase/FAD synthetase [Lutisporaceae bacterium]